MGLLHVDQLQLPQVSNNDFVHLGCLSKCASLVEQHPILVKMEECVKPYSWVHLDFPCSYLVKVDLLNYNLLPLMCLG